MRDLSKVAHCFAQKPANVMEYSAKMRRVLNISAARSLHKATQERTLFGSNG